MTRYHVNLTPYDMTADGEDKQVVELYFAALAIGRPFLTTPGVPKERVKLLREAFMRTVRDPEFLADAKALRLDINPMSGEKVQALCKRFLSFRPIS